MHNCDRTNVKTPAARLSVSTVVGLLQAATYGGQKLISPEDGQNAWHFDTILLETKLQEVILVSIYKIPAGIVWRC